MLTFDTHGDCILIDLILYQFLNLSFSAESHLLSLTQWHFAVLPSSSLSLWFFFITAWPGCLKLIRKPVQDPGEHL